VSWAERRTRKKIKKEEGRRELDLQRRRRKKEKRGGTYSKVRERKKIKKTKKDAWRNINDE
jgi:hypothetical protein